MAGQNRFIVNKGLKSLSQVRQTCVFISHRKSDKNAALGVTHYLKNLNIDVYIDEYDSLLSAATAAGDAAKIVGYIEGGILASTHLLGIVSPNTKGSWWVPFEIGAARQKNLSVAYLLLDNVDYLPEYLQITKHIKDQIELETWISKEFTVTSFALKSLDSSLRSIPRLPRVRVQSPSFIKAT